jgi:exopolyphosphatase/guanosine-5'-triphosphate,3'-diphosphate pyrophosphatase
MPAIRRAVIDVGTNSVKLLVADVHDGVVEPVIEESEQTRLGAGFYETHRLQPAVVAETARVVAAFARRARDFQAVSTRVIATSAARDAMNPDDLLSAIEKASGIKTEIISGEQEADWAFEGVATDPRLSDETLLLMDAGGGSTEFILGQRNEKYFRRSFPLGTVRLLEKLRLDDPPTAPQRLACYEGVKTFLLGAVQPELGPALERANKSGSRHGPVQLIGTGGTATILARMEGQMNDYDRAKIEAQRLTLARVRDWTDRLWSLPLAERRKTIGLPEKRADVILMGLAIYRETMEVFGFSALRVTTRGLRFAVVLNG